jgi:uncharacterized protein YecE (DUF72 family)
MDIRIGTSGFSFDDWIGPIYPKGLKKQDWLKFYESDLGFKTVEINYTYYAMPTVKTLSSMNSKTTDDFSFVVKAHRSMTHDLWSDKKREVMADNAEVFKRFNASLSPLKDNGKLICVLAQFPYFFHNNKKNLDYLKRFKERMGDIPTIIEFRNRNWHTEKSIDFLKENNLGYCVVDEPKIKGLMPFNPVATTEISYVRLHGRNKRWYNVPMEVRYDYLYSNDELTEFLDDIVNLALKSTTTMVFFNNCHAGSAAKNAIELAKMLLDEE